MKNSRFVKMSSDELLSVNGGALGGAVLGYMVGGTIGYVVGGIAYRDSIRSGSSPAMARKASDAVYLNTVTTFTTIGFFLLF